MKEFPLLCSKGMPCTVLAYPAGTRRLLVLSSSLIMPSEKFSFQKYWGDLERVLLQVSAVSIMLQLCVSWLSWSTQDFSLPRIQYLDELSSQIPFGNLTVLLKNGHESLQMLPATQQLSVSPSDTDLLRLLEMSSWIGKCRKCISVWLGSS